MNLFLVMLQRMNVLSTFRELGTNRQFVFGTRDQAQLLVMNPATCVSTGSIGMTT